MKNIIFFSLTLVIFVTRGEFPISDKTTISLGNDAYLPCDTSSSSKDDSLAVILWFKDNRNLPIYSIDARNPNSEPIHRKIELGNEQDRYEFIESGRSSYLHIKKVKQNDRGIYRCRVDFRFSPTRNTVLELDII